MAENELSRMLYRSRSRLSNYGVRWISKEFAGGFLKTVASMKHSSASCKKWRT